MVQWGTQACALQGYAWDRIFTTYYYPVVFGSMSSHQYVFYRGGNGRMYEAFYDSSGWHGGLDMCGSYNWGCTPSTGPGAAVNPSNDYQYVFYRGSDGDI